MFEIHLALGRPDILLSLPAAKIKFHEGAPGGKAVQRFGGTVKAVLEVILCALHFLFREDVHLQARELLHQGREEGLHVLRVQYSGNGEHTHAVHARVGDVDTVHQMLFKVIFAFEIGGAVARQKIAQDIEVGPEIACKREVTS